MPKIGKTGSIQGNQNDETCLYLEPVNELRDGNISMVLKDVNRLEVASGSILEFNPQEVPGIGRRATAKLKGESRGIVRDTLEFGVNLDDIGLVEEGNEWLVGG